MVAVIFRALRPVAPRLAMLLLGLSMAGSIQALSIGEVQLHSNLGDPLRASVSLGHLGSLSEHNLVVGYAPEEDYKALGISRAAARTSIKFALSVDKKGMASVVLSTEQPVSEPLVELVMEVRWPTGRALKEFTLLPDLP